MLSDLSDSAWLMSGEADVNNYLYVADADSQPIFHGIEGEMAQLNDFCLLCIAGTSERLAELQETLRDYESGEERAEDPDLGDITDVAVDALAVVHIPRWQQTERFMVRAMSLLLLAIFSEKCLQDLAKYLAPPEAPGFKKKRSETEISGLLRYLNSTCALDFREPEASRLVRDKCRRIRNDFAHGRWDAVDAAIADYSLSSAFGAVTALFDAIDAASSIES
jgi:hypothetical protein